MRVIDVANHPVSTLKKPKNLGLSQSMVGVGLNTGNMESEFNITGSPSRLGLLPHINQKSIAEESNDSPNFGASKMLDTSEWKTEPAVQFGTTTLKQNSNGNTLPMRSAERLKFLDQYAALEKK